MKRPGKGQKKFHIRKYLKAYVILVVSIFALTSVRLTTLNTGGWESTSLTIAGAGHSITTAEAFSESLQPSLQFAFLSAAFICVIIAIMRKMCTGSIDW